MDIARRSLAELRDDPLTGLVIKSDGVDRRELDLLLEQSRAQAIAGDSTRKFLSAATPKRGDGAMLTPSS